MGPGGETSDAAVLLADQEEAPEVEGLLDQLGLPWRRHDPASPAHGARVVLGSAEAVVALVSALPNAVGVVLGADSRTGPWAPGVDYWVRRPADPAALRVLLAHLLRPAQDRRLATRVSLELPVRLRAGLRARTALLTELSATGARVRTPARIRVGARVELQLPPGPDGSRPCRVTGRVLRDAATRDDAGLALTFTSVPVAAGERLRGLLRHEPAESGAAERRGDPRHRYARRVIARGSTRPHVLLGRDLSMGGMRVEREPSLELGDKLQVALYARPGAVPMVVSAWIERDDGERGLFLRFDELKEAERGFLSGMVDDLPALEAQEGPVVVSEVVSRGDPADDGGP